jgi:cation diffusion facilitator family transporter
MESRNNSIKNVALLGIVFNIILLTLKLIVGFASRSQAMIADGFNSAGDVFASLMTLIGNKISAQPYDKDHPYGHGKAEYIFSMIISFSLAVVSFNIIKSAIDSLSNKEVFLYTPWLVVVALFTIITKFCLFKYCNKVGHRYNSLLALANAEDHRNDVFVTLFTLMSIITGFFNLFIVDAIVGVLIGIWIGYTSFSIFSSAYYVLMDTTIDPAIKEELVAKIESIDGIDHVDTITSKPVGLTFLLIVKISVDGSQTIFKGHEIGNQVKHQLMDYDYVDDVIVHLNATQIHPQKNYIK